MRSFQMAEACAWELFVPVLWNNLTYFVYCRRCILLSMTLTLKKKCVQLLGERIGHS